MKHRFIFALSMATALASASVGASPASARTIVLTNDDGLTSNVLALYHVLKADGHDVIVSVPCMNQSGMGAAAYFAKPLGPLSAPCRNAAAAAGDPAVGAMTRPGLPADDFHYVSGTPVMALLHGLDVVGHKRWGKAPDLVLSGPNEGQNVGSIIMSSGTVSAAQYAGVRGIPAIAISAGQNSVGDEKLNNPVSVAAAARSAELVRHLDKRAGRKALLPAGIALNVNYPDNPQGAPWKLTRVGTYQAYKISFSDSMARDATPAMLAMAGQHGATIPQAPGLLLAMNEAEPTPEQRNDETIVYRTAIAVSPMRVGYDFGSEQDATMRKLLGKLLSGKAAK